MDPSIQPTGPAAPIKDLLRFVLAGRAVFTIENPATGGRFTYRVRAKSRTAPGPTREGGSGDPLWFVAVLTGPDNTRDYSYLGILAPDRDPYLRGTPSRPVFRWTARSAIARDAPSVVAFAWFWRRLRAGRDLAGVRVCHEGRCGRCGRALTVPESVESGLGPECASRAA